MNFQRKLKTKNVQNLVKNREILYIFRYQISRFLPFSIPGSGAQFGTGIPGSDSGTGRSKWHSTYICNFYITWTITEFSLKMASHTVIFQKKAHGKYLPLKVNYKYTTEMLPLSKTIILKIGLLNFNDKMLHWIYGSFQNPKHS